MEQVLFYLAMLLPPFLAFGIVVVSEPRWLGILMWLASAAIAVGFWYWAFGAKDPGGRIFAYAIATYMSLPVLVAIGVRFFTRTPSVTDKGENK